MEPTEGKDFGDSGETRLTPEQAQVKYSVKSGAYYKRLEAAGIKHRKDDKGYFLDAQQIEILDKLDAHLKNGGLLSNFGQNKLSVIGNKDSASIALAAETVEESVLNVDNDLARELDRSAQSIAATLLADARNRLTAEYLKNPSLMAEDLKSEVFIQPTPVTIDQEWAGHHLAASILKSKIEET